MVATRFLCADNINTVTFVEALRGMGGGGVGGPMSPVKRLVSVFINACRLLSALPSLSQFGRGRLSLAAISFHALSLLFGPCRLSEFTWLPWQGLFVTHKLFAVLFFLPSCFVNSPWF